MNDAPSPETLAAQAMGDVDTTSGALAPAIHPSTTYERSPDGTYPSGLVYTRADNPTYDHAERLLATLEGGAAGMLFASGSAAATAVFQSLLPGDHVLVSRVLYWGVRKWLAEFGLTWGLDVEFTDTCDLAALRAAIRPGRTRLIWVETPANPMWEITVLAAQRRRHARAVRGLAAAAGHAHPVPAGAPRLGERPGDRHPLPRPPGGCGRAVPGAALAPGPPDRGPPDARRVRRDAVDPAGRRSRARAGGAARRPGVQAGHLARRSGEPHRAPAQHGRALLPGARRPAAPVGRHRGPRRPDRRPRNRARRRARPPRRRPRRASGGLGGPPPMDLAGTVAAVLERGVLSSVIARGGGLRVAAVEDGVAILEVTGSPGAVLPLVSRIEALIRVAVP